MITDEQFTSYMRNAKGLRQIIAAALFIKKSPASGSHKEVGTYFA